MRVSDLNPEFIERYQILLSQDPKSKVFAPLAEAYRKMKWIDHAESICKEGVKYHPHFPSGRLVLAKIFIDRGLLKEAVDELNIVCDLSPENILAYRLMAQTLIDLKRPKEALKAFKMVLFLNPNDQASTKMVTRLESLTADEYDDELFEMKPLARAVEKISPQALPQLNRTLERAISLADAFVARNDFDKAIETLDQAEDQIGPHPEIKKRRRFLTSRSQPIQDEEPADLKPLLQDMRDAKNRKVENLKSMLQRISDRRVE